MLGYGAAHLTRPTGLNPPYALGKLPKANGAAPRMNAKLTTARFFMQRMLPETALRLARIQAGAKRTMELPDDVFVALRRCLLIPPPLAGEGGRRTRWVKVRVECQIFRKEVLLNISLKGGL